MDRKSIIKAVDAYAKASGLKHSTICQYALGNRLVYKRLTTGGSCSVSSVEKLIAWMAANPPHVKGNAA